jgi:GT2 family glycosyltransferase
LTAALGDTPDLTVIVIGHDVRDDVLKCLASLREHAGALALQPIYVDNGSGDGSADAVQRAFPEAEVVRRERNEGVPARNHGLRRAQGRHRMFLDADATVTPGALETLVAFLDEHPRAGVAGPRLVYPDGTHQLSARRYPPLMLPLLRRPPLQRWLGNGRTVRRHLMADAPPERRRRVEYVLGACQAFRAEAHAAAGEIDERIFYGPDDADWCLAIRRAGYDVVFVPEATVVHDYRRLSAARPVSRLALRHLRAHVYFQWKWRRERRRLIAEGRAMDAEAASMLRA